MNAFYDIFLHDLGGFFFCGVGRDCFDYLGEYSGCGLVFD